MTVVAVRRAAAPTGLAAAHADRRALAVLAGLPAAVVTLVWAFSRPLPMIDDWSLIAGARAGTGFFWASRPGEALVHWAVFTASDSHPVPPLVILAVLNVAVGALLWTFGRRRWGRGVATLTALVWAAIPNRGSSRMWASCIPNLAAGTLALTALVLADHEEPSRRRAAVVIGVAAAACLTYEGTDALAAAAVVLLAWHHRGLRDRLRALAAGGAVLVAAATWVATHTAKTGKLHLAAYGSRLVSTQFGIGLWPAKALVLGLVMFAVVLVALLAPILGRSRIAAEEAMVWGAGAMVLGAAVFFATGFPLADSGLFDRGNVYTDFGTSLVIGGALALAWRGGRALGAGCAAAVLAVLTWGNVSSVQAYVRSAADARAVLADVRTLPEYPTGSIVIGPLPDHAGVAGFTAAYDLTAAMVVHDDLPRAPVARA